MNWNEVLALLSVAGFATQRTLELLDPLFAALAKLLVRFAGDEKAAKTWVMNVGGVSMGGLVVLLGPDVTLPGIGETLSKFVVALAISMGSNAANSLLKFGEYAKESRKRETEPLPEIKIVPATVTLSPGSKIQFLVAVSGTDSKDVTWAVLEANGGSVTKTGQYTAPAEAGTYHVAVVSVANPAASATAVVTIQ